MPPDLVLQNENQNSLPSYIPHNRNSFVLHLEGFENAGRYV